jgi:predicted alpha/beta-hydrolase family hydrolase
LQDIRNFSAKTRSELRIFAHGNLAATRAVSIMKIEIVSISIDQGGRVSGVLSIPDGHRAGEGAGIIIAHGANNDMNNRLIVLLADGLAQTGYPTLRFNFLYKERGRKAPDSQGVLVRTWQSAYEFFRGHPEYAPGRILAAGKSMGGRVASQMAAEGLLPAGGLIFLGYPLHPPGDKEKLRSAHLFQIGVPVLFFAGTRDSLCDVLLLRGVLEGLSVPWDLEVIEGGNHSFRVPKSSGRTQEEIYRRILDKTVAWLGVRGEAPGSRASG